jgi:hypothetical protein
MEDENPEKQINTKDYWKCKECGQIVEIDFDACWNCQNNKPELIENPTIIEILNYLSDDQNQLDINKYWKCPNCDQTVEIDFDTCWNCQNNKPDVIENPSIVEILKYKSDDENQLDPIKLLRCPKCGETGLGKIGSCWNCGYIPD